MTYFDSGYTATGTSPPMDSNKVAFIDGVDYVSHNHLQTRKQTPVCVRGSIADSTDLYRIELALALQLLLLEVSR